MLLISSLAINYIRAKVDARACAHVAAFGLEWWPAANRWRSGRNSITCLAVQEQFVTIRSQIEFSEQEEGVRNAENAVNEC